MSTLTTDRAGWRPTEPREYVLWWLDRYEEWAPSAVRDLVCIAADDKGHSEPLYVSHVRAALAAAASSPQEGGGGHYAAGQARALVRWMDEMEVADHATFTAEALSLAPPAATSPPAGVQVDREALVEGIEAALLRRYPKIQVSLVRDEAEYLAAALAPLLGSPGETR